MAGTNVLENSEAGNQIGNGPAGMFWGRTLYGGFRQFHDSTEAELMLARKVARQLVVGESFGKVLHSLLVPFRLLESPGVQRSYNRAMGNPVPVFDGLSR